MACLVTGGTGFIGCYIVRDLVNQGCGVVAYDMFVDVHQLGEVLNEDEKKMVQVVKGDVLDLANLIHVIKNHHITTIVHMASLLATGSRTNPPLAIRVNCEGTSHIFEAARILGLSKVVWASSVAVFAPQEGLIPNDAPHKAWDIYGACKSLNESLAKHYFDSYGVDSIGLRFPLIYGAGQREGVSARLTSEIIVKPALGKEGKVPFGDDTLNWLYVEDASRAVLMSLKVPKTKTRVFNISGDVRPVKDLVNYSRRLFPGVRIEVEPGYMGIGSRFDANPLVEEVGFKPSWMVEKALTQIAQIVRRQHGLPPI